MGGRRDGHGLRFGVVVVVCVAVLVAPAPAGATFTRPFLREIAKAGSGPGSGPLVAGGVAVDGNDDLWVESAEKGLAEFGPAYPPSENAFLEVLSGMEEPKRLERLAIEDASERFYVLGETNHGLSFTTVVAYDRAGKVLEGWGSYEGAVIAIDNSPVGSLEDPSACGSSPLAVNECYVYLGEKGGNGGLRRFSSKGEEEPFECETSECQKYIVGNEITGTPELAAGVFGVAGLDGGIAVDSSGDIYATGENAVYEYAPSGQFIQAFKLENREVPPVEGHIGGPKGIAVDPVSKHLVVGVDAVAGSTRVGAVDEFDTETGRFVAQITEAEGGGGLESPAGVALDSHGDVYVADKRGEEAVVDVYGPGAFAPTLTLAATDSREPDSAVLSGSVNPGQHGNASPAPVTECYFQYVSETIFDESLAGKEEGFAKATKAACVEPDASEIPPEPEVARAVHAKVNSLTAGVTYRYRLVAATEAAEKGGTAETASRAFTTPAAPEVLSTAASGVSASFADLDAQINPRGADTNYFFEYGLTASYGQDVPVHSEAAPHGASIGSGGATGGSLESVSQNVSDLAPGSEYHFRVVAENEAGTTDGPDETFVTLPEVAARLPDGRAYELVTPAEKEGGSDMFAENETSGEFKNETSTGTPSGAGDGFILETRSAFGAFPSAFFNMYVFQRDAAKGEWTYRSLASPLLGVQSIGGSGVASKSKVVFDPVDLSRVGFTDGVGSEVGEEGTRTLELLGEPGGPYTTLRADPPFHESESASRRVETWVVGASRDLSHIVLDSNSNGVCPEPGGAGAKVEEGDVLCEWDGGGVDGAEGGEARPELRLVNVAPGSESKPASACGALLGDGELAGGAQHAVSADGATVFFTAPRSAAREKQILSGAGCPETGHPSQLYARVGVRSGAETVHETLKVSAPDQGVFEEEGGKRIAPREYSAFYVGASADGSKVFFVSEAWLTPDHPETHDRELYECEIVLEGEQPVCELTRVSAGVAGTEAMKTGAGVDWVPAVAAEGADVYFTAFNVLANGGSREKHAANSEDSAVNVYRYDTTSGATSYLATVDTEDYTDQERCAAGADFGVALDFIGPCSEADWYTTPNGEYLLFGASLPIHGYNEAEHGCTQLLPFEANENDGRCSELYRYDVGAAERGEQSIVCVSCGPGNADAAGNAEFARSATVEAAASPPAGISANGAYVFFDSPAKLVAQADNDTLDVYEWEEQGTGGCGVVGGCVRLISSPNDSFPSYFLGYSSYEYETGMHEKRVVEGGNVFFGTHAQLVPQDSNAVGNIYDARICEPESPCIKPPPSPPTQCEGNTCQTPPTPAISQTPATRTLGRNDNLTVGPPQVTKPSAAEVRARKLASALKVCHRDRKKARRVLCEKRAHRKYAPARKGRGK
jgi:hypothetical protein